MDRRSPFDKAEFCDFNGEYSGACATASGWIDVLAEKGTAADCGEDLSESVSGYEWVVGHMRSADKEMQY